MSKSNNSIDYELNWKTNKVFLDDFDTQREPKKLSVNMVNSTSPRSETPFKISSNPFEISSKILNHHTANVMNGISHLSKEADIKKSDLSECEIFYLPDVRKYAVRFFKNEQCYTLPAFEDYFDARIHGLGQNDVEAIPMNHSDRIFYVPFPSKERMKDYKESTYN